MYVKGMIVKMSEQGHKSHGIGLSNPKDVTGVVTGPDDYDKSWFGVNWSNGHFNNYEEGDLVVVGEESL